MKRILTLCCLLLLTSGCVKGTGDQFLKLQAPDPLVYPLAGAPTRISEYLGKDLVLVFWSTQCSTSMGELKHLAKDFASNPKLADVVGIAINIDSQEREPKVMTYINQMPKSHLQFSYSANDIYDEAYRKFDVSVVPQFFVIDKTGVVRAEGLDSDVVTSYFSHAH